METLLPPCPCLPPQEERLAAVFINELGNDRGPLFYERCLHIAQSQWRQGLPARAILFVNRALGAAISEDDPILQRLPLPYPAMIWLLRHADEEHFIGNPRRHWQHLATRMVEPRKELRTWRAWACWQLSRVLMPDLPADEKQIAEEGIIEPSKEEIFGHLKRLGHKGEAEAWLDLVDAL